jgi:hypothetical protein
MIAALFVAINGPYFNLPNVDPWDVTRDARLYAGPHRVIAHPPCERWGRYWSGGPSAKVRRELGDDGGCFASALASVRTYGGVLEHPAHSHAWKHFGLARPPEPGGWVRADSVGWTCRVDQGRYGHPARKATWLYYVGQRRPIDLDWAASEARSREVRADGRTRAARGDVENLSKRQRTLTPVPFRDALIALASDEPRRDASHGAAQSRRGLPQPRGAAAGAGRRTGPANSLVQGRAGAHARCLSGPADRPGDDLIRRRVFFFY